MALGEVMWARREEVKAGAAAACRQKNMRSMGSSWMRITIHSSHVDPVLKLSESEKKARSIGVKARSTFLRSFSVKYVLILIKKKAVKTKH
jgi:hypothetical protein